MMLINALIYYYSNFKEPKRAGRIALVLILTKLGYDKQYAILRLQKTAYNIKAYMTLNIFFQIYPLNQSKILPSCQS